MDANLLCRGNTRDLPLSQVLGEIIQGRFLGDSEVSYRVVPVSLDGGASGDVDADTTKSVAEGEFSHGLELT